MTPLMHRRLATLRAMHEGLVARLVGGERAVFVTVLAAPEATLEIPMEPVLRALEHNLAALELRLAREGEGRG